MNLDLKDRTALVTGAARGIGARIAACFVEQGCQVIVSDLDEAAARACATELGAGATALRLDVRDRTALRTLVERVVAERSGLDILVNNAGLLAASPFEETDGEEWDRLIAVNLTGVFNCVQAVAPVMRRKGKGVIINIASVSHEKGGGAFGNVWYGATKAGVVAMTKGLGRELGPHGIRVNAIAPAVVETDMVRDRLTAEARERILARFPLGRLAQADDVAQLAVFLASDDASYMTGTTIVANGGWCTT